MKKLSKKKMPKARHVWKINPKSRVKDSEKVYKRSSEKKKKVDWLGDISWFGD